MKEKTGEKSLMRTLAMRQPGRTRVSSDMWLAEEEIQDVPRKPSKHLRKHGSVICWAFMWIFLSGENRRLIGTKCWGKTVG